MNGGDPRAGPGGVAGFTQSMLEATAEAMVSRGLRDAGYVYLNLDCGWTSGYRDDNGLQVNTTAFPSMTGLIDKVHSLDMKYAASPIACPAPAPCSLPPHAHWVSPTQVRDVRWRAALAVLQPRPPHARQRRRERFL